MKKKKEKLNKNLIILIVVILALGIVWFLRVNKNGINSDLQTTTGASIKEQTKEITSKLLKLRIVVPKQFNVKDEEIRIIISNSDGKIIVSRNGTQFNSLDDYMQDFDIKHKTQVTNEIKLPINNYPASSRIIRYPGSTLTGDKIYFIFISDAVYHISTSSPALFGDLDKIARSFRYTP